MSMEENIYEKAVRTASQHWILNHEIQKMLAECQYLAEAITHACHAIHDGDTWRFITETGDGFMIVCILNATSTEPSVHFTKVKDNDKARAWAHALAMLGETIGHWSPIGNGDQPTTHTSSTNTSDNPKFGA